MPEVLLCRFSVSGVREGHFSLYTSCELFRLILPIISRGMEPSTISDPVTIMAQPAE